MVPRPASIMTGKDLPGELERAGEVDTDHPLPHRVSGLVQRENLSFSHWSGDQMIVGLCLT